MPDGCLSDGLLLHKSIGVEDDRRRERKRDSTGNDFGSGSCRHTLVRGRPDLWYTCTLFKQELKLPEDTLFVPHEPPMTEDLEASEGLPRCAFWQAARALCNWVSLTLQKLASLSSLVPACGGVA